MTAFVNLTCSRCGNVPKLCTSVVVVQDADSASQERICTDCFVTEDANWPWEHMLQIDVLSDGSLRVYFPPGNASSMEGADPDGSPLRPVESPPSEAT